MSPEAATNRLRELGVNSHGTATLAKKRRLGTGPKYRRIAGRIDYSDQDLRDYADALRGEPVCSTDEERARGVALPDSQAAA
jgi:hypothetical protein